MVRDGASASPAPVCLNHFGPRHCQFSGYVVKFEHGRRDNETVSALSHIDKFQFCSIGFAYHQIFSFHLVTIIKCQVCYEDELQVLPF
jgi:hypothetical protein